MDISAADIVAFIGIVLTFILSTRGLKKNRNEALEKEASAALLYQKMATEGAERETRLLQDVMKLRGEIQSLKKIIENRDQVISYLQSKIIELEETNSAKDKRIEELEALTQRQAVKIEALQAELEELRKVEGVRE